MAHFYSSANYGGLEYIGYGQYSTCYNLDYSFWNKKTASMTTGNTCRVYLQPNCVGPDTVVDWNNVATFPYSSGSGIASFVCNEPGPALPPSPPYFPTSSSTPIPTPTYVPPSPKSSSSKDGGNGTPTPTPSSSYIPPPPPNYSSSSTSKDGGNVTPTPTPTPPTSVYIPTLPPPKSSSYPSPPGALAPRALFPKWTSLDLLCGS